MQTFHTSKNIQNYSKGYNVFRDEYNAMESPVQLFSLT